MVSTTKKQDKNKNAKSNYIFAVGRRREAVARIRLYDPARSKVQIGDQEYQRGDVIVNGLPHGAYFRFEAYTPRLNKFFDATKALEKFMFSARVTGGGKNGQIDAVLHGMARALDKYNKEEYHSILREHGYLTRDARTRERRKVGMGGKARRKKQSPKR